MGPKLLGAVVMVKSPGHWADGEWGVIRKIIEGEYHVGIAGGSVPVQGILF